MNIQVLGSGCPTCHKLYNITQEAVTALQLSAEVEYVTGSKAIEKIISLGALSSPVLVVNNTIAMVGFTPDLEKVKKAIRQATK